MDHIAKMNSTILTITYFCFSYQSTIMLIMKTRNEKPKREIEGKTTKEQDVRIDQYFETKFNFVKLEVPTKFFR